MRVAQYFIKNKKIQYKKLYYEQSFISHDVSGLNPLSSEERLVERRMKEVQIRKIKIEFKGIDLTLFIVKLFILLWL